AIGATYVGPEDWLAHPGTVGKPLLGIPHICGPGGEVLGTEEIGTVYFEREERNFSYHNDPERTRATQHPEHDNWTTVGDLGYLDDDGFLYLTDRLAFMIISGGVNIYPQEIENLLVLHPKVADAAVIGAPDPDMGEKVVAVVQPMDMADAGPAFADELTAYLAPQLSRVKMPRQIDFREQLPRELTGKLYKRLLRDEYKEDYEKAQAPGAAA
ncbi:MAG: AMP-binding enzyme, partial [Novosphingobium sp.]